MNYLEAAKKPPGSRPTTTTTAAATAMPPKTTPAPARSFFGRREPQLEEDCVSSVIEAAREGDADEIHRLVKEEGANVKVRHQGDTALHVAARGDRAQACRALVDRGANVEAENLRKRTALFEVIN